MFSVSPTWTRDFTAAKTLRERQPQRITHILQPREDISVTMPTSARKSSLGASTRRGPQKYIRYRADDLEHGKRTGIAVGYVDRDSDEFEPFEKVIGQADLRTPPKPHMPARKKTQKTPVVQSEEEYEDEDGEMSMDIDDSKQKPWLIG